MKVSVTKRILVIDCQLAGISGDMIVGALLDLGVDIEEFIKTVKSIGDFLEGCTSLEIEVNDVTRKGFHAKKLFVKAEEQITHRTGAEIRNAILNYTEKLNLSNVAKKFALNSIDTLINAEAKVHGENREEVHLHEAGSADTIVDIVGTAIALDDLGLFRSTKIYSTHVAVGGGLFKFSHGTVPAPAPATIEILKARGFPFVGGPIEFELATPTGVALLVNMVDEVVSFYPAIKPRAIGYGTGTKDFQEIPNLLRVTLGEPLSYGLLTDEIYILETNLDDATGEVIGYSLDKLLQAGAKDVSVIPMSTKKNRPGHILKVIADKENVERLSLVLMVETGTLGVRIYPCQRYILNRESIAVNTEIEGTNVPVNVKIARDTSGNIIQIKPEYEDVKQLAEKINKSLRETAELLKTKAREVLLSR